LEPSSRRIARGGGAPPATRAAIAAGLVGLLAVLACPSPLGGCEANAECPPAPGCDLSPQACVPAADAGVDGGRVVDAGTPDGGSGAGDGGLDAGAVTDAGSPCDGGACGECAAPADCPGEDAPCGARTCVLRRCGRSATPAGTPLSTQTPHDCRVVVCDGDGGTASQADDTDLPVDGLECTLDLCDRGVASNPPVAPRTTCSEGGGMWCDGAGACAGCLDASDCGTSTECRTWSCVREVCSHADADAGTPAGPQMPGDCHLGVCDGAGGLTSIVDDTDFLDDGLECTYDVCTRGVPGHPAKPAGTSCDQGGTQCDGQGVCGP
jgi:hypothetical protein